MMNYRLDLYIHDYLLKRDLKATAQAFQAEGKVSSDPVGMIPSPWKFTVTVCFIFSFQQFVLMGF